MTLQVGDIRVNSNNPRIRYTVLVIKDIYCWLGVTGGQKFKTFVSTVETNTRPLTKLDIALK